MFRVPNYTNNSLYKSDNSVYKIEQLDFAADRYAIIFISDKKRSLNKDIFLYAKKAFIISDGYVDKNEQLFSLISRSNKIKIDLNRNNLSERGFGISNKLLLSDSK